MKIKTQTFSCWDSVSDAFTCTPRGPFETSNIKVNYQPKCSTSTSSSLEGSEKVGGLFEGVCLCCFSVCVLLIQLAFRSLINCHGIWLFWVNAITHAACSSNGCLPTAGPASTLPFFALPLFSLLPFFLSAERACLRIPSRSRRTTADVLALDSSARRLSLKGRIRSRPLPSSL